MKTHGNHFVCELSKCNAHALDDIEAVKHALYEAANAAGATVLEGYFHRFEPMGVSGLLCLAESHLSIHTWPEAGYAAVDIYTCGANVKPDNAIAILTAAFSAQRKHVTLIDRGLAPDANGQYSHSIQPLTEERHLWTPEPSAEAVSWYFENADPHERHLYQVKRWIVSKRSEFQHVGIIESDSYGKLLFLDGAVQSSQRDEYMYHEALIHPAMTLHANPERVLVLGGGEGASVREALRYPGVKHVTMIDIDGELVELCAKHLPEWSAGAFDDPRLRLVIADGKQWIEQTDEKFDVIFMDLTDQIDLGPSLQLYSQGFYKTIKSRLNPGGIFLVQSGEVSVCECFSHGTIRKTLASVFPQVESYVQHIPSFFASWSFIVASMTPQETPTTEELDRRILARLGGELRFYDGQTHKRMFMLPKDLRHLLATNGMIHITGNDFEKAFEASTHYSA